MNQHAKANLPGHCIDIELTRQLFSPFWDNDFQSLFPLGCRLAYPDYNFQEHWSWKSGPPENIQERQCCGGCRLPLTEHRCQQLWLRLCYELKYTHLQKYNDNNSKTGLVGKRGAFLPRQYKIKGIIPENAPPLCRENPRKSKSRVKRIAIYYATLRHTHRCTLDNECIWLASFSTIDQTHLRFASKTMPWFQRFCTCSRQVSP